MIFCTFVYMKPLKTLELLWSTRHYLCIASNITCHFTSANTLYRGFVDSHVEPAISYFQQISRKSMISNMSFNPVIVERDMSREEFSRPTHTTVNEFRELNNNVPELVIYLGKVLMLLLFINEPYTMIIRYFAQ